jgi:hypothetical protein
MSGKKNKQVTSRGGNSFLTINQSGDGADISNIKQNAAKSKKVNPNQNIRKKIKTEEEKIQDFADNVTKFLDKIEGLRAVLNSVVHKQYSEGVDRLKLLILKGKYKFLKPLLPLLIIVQKVNERWFNAKYGFEENNDDENEEKKPVESKKQVTFLELAEKNIIFTDNRKKPLYTLEQLKDKSGYVASESVITPMVMENIINAFNEVAPKAKAIPTPESGKYAGIQMSEVMAGINEQDIIEFLEYVRNFPRGYVGKNYRITESFAGWAVSGTPDD